MPCHVIGPVPTNLSSKRDFHPVGLDKVTLTLSLFLLCAEGQINYRKSLLLFSKNVNPVTQLNMAAPLGVN